MKKFYLLIFLIHFSFLSFGQEVKKYRTESVATKSLNDSGEWEEWTDWKNSDLLTIMDLTSRRITVYTDPKNAFDYVKLEKNTDNEEDVFLQFNCVDDFGTELGIRFFYDSENKIQLYIDYPDLLIAYNLRQLE